MTTDIDPTYVALLRGINVGGHKKVAMAELRKVFAGMGCEKVRTVLASGNVIFESGTEPAELTRQIPVTLEKAFGFSIPVLVRPLADIEGILALDPFAGVEVTPDTRRYVTFLRHIPGEHPGLPRTVAEGGFRLLGMGFGALFTVLDLSRSGTVDLMAYLDKAFGKDITTRTWKTLVRIGQA